MASTPISFNANAVISAAFSDLGVFQPGDVIPPADANGALNRLNAMISGWGISPLLIPLVDREVFNVVANQSTYTMGPGGDFDTIRPQSLNGAGLLMPTQSASTGPIEIPIGMLTDDMYQAIQTKDLTNALWTDVYFNPTYDDGFASVFLWPTPNSTTYRCVLYRGEQLQGFTNLTTLGDFPPGAFEAMQYNLGKRLAPSYGGTGWTGVLEEMANESLFLFKRANTKLNDLAVDPAMTQNHRGGYNIQTDQGG